MTDDAVRGAAETSCCSARRWTDAPHDLGHAGGFDIVLRTCASCGAKWMDIWCEAAAAGSAIRVSGEDATRMRALPPGPERKAFLREWLSENE